MKVAVIPARGGSKRIPKKNIKDFLGKPVIAWSIEAALNSELFDVVLVSTDDFEIRDIARSFGAVVPDLRPSALADDFTGTNEVVRYEILSLEGRGYVVSHACCIYATAPFVKKQDLEKGFKVLQETNSLFAFSVTSFPFPVQRALNIDKRGQIRPMFPEDIDKRSQDLNEGYHDAGQFYWGVRDAFVDRRNLFRDGSAPVFIERKAVQDIDTLEDWERAEALFQVLQL